MKILLDQSVDARLVGYLRSRGHDVIRVGREYPPGLPDREVLARAWVDERLLITDDRDFGDLVFRHGQPQAGVSYLRLGLDADLPLRIERLDHVFSHYGDQLREFLVVTRQRVRTRSTDTGQPR